jgi:hypothetical protein
LSLTLLTGAALLIESLFRLRAEPLGYRMDGLLIARLDLPKAAYPALADRLLFCNRLAQSLAAMPALEAAVRSGKLVHAEAAGGRAARETGFIARDLIFPEYFRVAGLPLAAGREFGPWIRDKASRWRSWIGNSRAAISRTRTLWASTSGWGNWAATRPGERWSA